MKCLVKGRHDPSRRKRCDLRRHSLSTMPDNSPSYQPIIPYPTGRGFWMSHSRHSMPGYPHLVPSGQIHLTPYVDAHGQLPDRRPILTDGESTLSMGQDTKLGCIGTAQSQFRQALAVGN